MEEEDEESEKSAGTRQNEGPLLPFPARRFYSSSPVLTTAILLPFFLRRISSFLFPSPPPPSKVDSQPELVSGSPERGRGVSRWTRKNWRMACMLRWLSDLSLYFLPGGLNLYLPSFR